MGTRRRVWRAQTRVQRGDWGKMNCASRVQQLRERAEQCRVYANIAHAEQERNEYLALAAAYEGLAHDEELLGQIRQRGLNLKRELSRLPKAGRPSAKT
jgi:hypothetical protein